jgi:hypoxanthine-DNA glycosylase
VLILGSMPGVESLRRQRYYAHPRNCFWPLLAGLLGFDADLDYARRLAELRRHRIALWDVLLHCVRDASADATIRDETPNRIVELLHAQPSIERILLNGRKAEQLFRRLVLPDLARAGRRPLLRVMPSTSPAHAAMPFPRKRALWRQGLLGR